MRDPNVVGHGRTFRREMKARFRQLFVCGIFVRGPSLRYYHGSPNVEYLNVVIQFSKASCSRADNNKTIEQTVRVTRGSGHQVDG